MNSIEITRQVLLFFVFLLVQIFFAKNLILFQVAFCFLYINFLLTLPLFTPKGVLLLLGFLIGFIIDNFYDTLGMHSMACVLIAYLRPYTITLLSSKNEFLEISIKETGLSWFLYYCLILTFIHHFLLFFLQQFNMRFIFDTLSKVVASTLFTVFCMILVQYMFFSPIASHARK